jgi:hypothetical protein
MTAHRDGRRKFFAMVVGVATFGATASHVVRAHESDRFKLRARYAATIGAPCNGPASATITGSNGVVHSRRLGHATMASSTECDTFGATSSAVGTLVVEASNGDELVIGYTSTGNFTSATTIEVEGDYTIDGGTGDFAEATGTGRLIAHVTLTGPTTGEVKLHLRGTLDRDDHDDHHDHDHDDHDGDHDGCDEPDDD